MSWVDEAIKLKYRKNNPVSWTNLPSEMAKLFPDEEWTYYKLRSALRRHPSYKKPVEYEDKRTYTEQDIAEFIDTMKALQKAGDKIDTKQTKATIRITENKPIAIAWWSDWHIGGRGVDYEQFESDLQKIEETEGLYFIGGGDYKDNYISGTHPGGNFEQILRPGQQDFVVKHYMSRVADKCLALVRGCHDDWDKKQGDKDFLETLCDITDSVNLWHGGDLFIKLGSQQYHFKCRHKYKFESSLNTLNSMRRIMEVQGPCDAALVAHLHNVDIEQRHLMGDMRILARAGSYKILDEYGQKLAGYKGKLGIPVIVINPDKKEMVGFKYLDEGITYLKAVRTE